ncbi:flagellar brake protein [Senegalia massiliensis]|uniref:flagellar brake protein n=1 Tax=Senegalia massiliensis TaxID=1720316 RepID=UPI001030B79B|nr:PilZ domain-containing protein [Senegalia massiliensis]
MKKNKSTLKIGDKIEIHIANQKYVSQVINVINENIYIILGPIKFGSIIKIPNGKEIKIMYSLKNKGRIWFNGIVEKSSTNNIYKLLIRKTSDVNKVQQRQYFRLKKIIEVDITNEVNKPIKGFAEDISGEGMKIVTKEDLKLNDKLNIGININDKSLSITSNIVRKVFDNRTGNYYYGISFEEIHKGCKEDIIKFIFEEQRILRKKGLE